MITLILLLIIILLIGFIIWIFKEFFVIMPKEEIEPAKSNEGDRKKATESIVASSVVGTTNFEHLKTPATKSKKVVPPEELKDAFMDNEFEMEGGDYEPIETELPKEEQSEVVEVSDPNMGDGNDEDKQIQSKICYDYFQIDSAIHSVVLNKPLSEEDARTLDGIKGTTFEEVLLAKYYDNVRVAVDALAKVEN